MLANDWDRLCRGDVVARAPFFIARDCVEVFLDDMLPPRQPVAPAPKFVEKCIAEFDAVDPKGMAFRYAGEGAEILRLHFRWLHAVMEHAYHALEGIRVYLVEMHGQNAEYESYLQSEYGGDML